jgi:hypothetical protein
MPMFWYARPAIDPIAEQKIRKLAGARHAPADWIQRAKIITLSWGGLPTTTIAAKVGCHAKTCGNGCTGSTPRAWTGWGIGRYRDGRDG